MAPACREGQAERGPAGSRSTRQRSAPGWSSGTVARARRSVAPSRRRRRWRCRGGTAWCREGPARPAARSPRPCRTRARCSSRRVVETPRSCVPRSRVGISRWAGALPSQTSRRTSATCGGCGGVPSRRPAAGTSHAGRPSLGLVAQGEAAAARGRCAANRARPHPEERRTRGRGRAAGARCTRGRHGRAAGRDQGSDLAASARRLRRGRTEVDRAAVRLLDVAPAANSANR